MEKKLALFDVPEDLREELTILYKIGVGIDEIEYLLMYKLHPID